MNRDALESWRDGATKNAIIGFVTESATEGSPRFIPEADRIATFDNDGTLWVEQPAPPQVPFLLQKLAAQVKADPTLAEKAPYREIVAKDESFLGAVARQEPEAIRSFLSAVGAAWEGTTPEQYEEEVKQYFAANPHPKFARPFTELVYRPMLELLDLLRGHDWRIFVASGGGRDFMRVIAEDVWGVPKENVIGSAAEFEYKAGSLTRTPNLHGSVALGRGKPEDIFARTGRLPRFAAGNADVDIEMLEVADFRLAILHDDDEREYAYTAAAESFFAKARQDGWAVASMKDDWAVLYDDGGA